MAYFYLNKNQQSNGDHEAHQGSCNWLPNEENREYLGIFTSSNEAVSHAKYLHPYWKINGCFYCCPESNTD